MYLKKKGMIPPVPTSYLPKIYLKSEDLLFAENWLKQENLVEKEFVVMVTRAGIIKRTALSEFKNVRTAGITAISADEGDELVSARITRGTNDIFLCSKDGMSIRFNEQDVRPLGRTARGVIGMNLEKNNQIVALEVLEKSSGDEAPVESEILTVTENGYGKRTPVTEFRLQGRGGVGVINMKSLEKNGTIIGSRQVSAKTDIMLVSNRGQMIRIHVGEISEQGRNSQGVRLITLESGEKLVSFELMAMAIVEDSSDTSDKVIISVSSDGTDISQ